MDLLACAYRNRTDRMVIIRCEGREGFYLERVVFPFELLTFECPADEKLEVWTHGLGGPELMDSLPVAELELDSPKPNAQQDLRVPEHYAFDFEGFEAAAG
ncbi:MAG: DUF1830 domain-containing protein [Cyanobacteriota bacterium]|nr:DUF1830 domain-containing protein [Cyanobacteriota bacterium]